MKFIKDIVKGIMIGIANIIPGVSGGTMAVSMGIYDEIIGSITNVLKQFKKSVTTLFPYIIGMVIGLLGLAKIIELLLGEFSLQTNMAFIGLILGGLPILLKRFKGKKIGVSNGIVFLLFFGLIVGLQAMKGAEATDVVITLSTLEVIKLFFIGVIASATMVIPGVSGSMILMLIGYYNPIIEAINAFVEAAIHMDMPTLFHQVGILAPFGIGVVIGIFAIAKLIEVLLQKFETLTFSAILGLVVASPFAILMSAVIPTLTVVTIATSAFTFVVGFLIAYKLGE